jgi:hypothetical protein
LSFGIGDRTAEGYGRVLLNPSFLCDPEMQIEKISAAQTAKLPSHFNGTLSDSERGLDKKVFEDIKTEYLKTVFRKASRRYIEKYFDTKEDPHTLFQYANLSKAPSSSQFGILRELASVILEAGDVSPVSHLLATMDEKNSNRQTWNSEWKAWLEDISGDRLDLWAVVEDSDLLQDEEQIRRIKEDLRIFALSTFLDALCGTIFDRRAASKSEGGIQNGA